MKIDTDESHGYNSPVGGRRNPKKGVNGRTKLLCEVTGHTRAS